MLANSRFWGGLFLGPNEEPTKSFRLDSKQGPTHVASRSGSILEHTGHLAYLIMQTSKEMLELSGGLKEETFKKKAKVRKIPPRSGRHTLVAILPIAVSFTTCALCGCRYDWFRFLMILLGIVSSSTSSLVLGSACLKLQGMNLAPTAPPGDGILMDGDDIVLLLGKEEDVATITRGRFFLEYAARVRWRSRKGKRKRSVLEDGMQSAKLNRDNDAENGQNSSRLKQVVTPLEQVAVQ
ncbi:hypothetical protein EDB19DRAFT_2040589 [Suillus lakei]|nr:hypothetical protein EDB19DRAFT_2040589 [Suillus lakei]